MHCVKALYSVGYIRISSGLLSVIIKSFLFCYQSNILKVINIQHLRSLEQVRCFSVISVLESVRTYVFIIYTFIVHQFLPCPGLIIFVGLYDLLVLVSNTL
jgi:hypothetical protein